MQNSFGREFIRESLRLRNESDARFEASRRMASYQEKFQRLRGSEAATPMLLVRRDVARMVSEWELQQLQRISTQPVLVPETTALSQAEIDDEMLATADMLRELQLAGGEATNNAVEALAHNILLDKGFAQCPDEAAAGIQSSNPQRADVDRNSPEYAYLKTRVAEALKVTWRATLAKHHGRSRIDEALNPPLPSQDVPGQVSLGELIGQFIEQKERDQYGARKLYAYNVASEIMGEVFGASKPINEITNAECRRLVHVLRNIPKHARKRLGAISYVEAAQRGSSGNLALRSNSTIQSNINTVSAMFNWAVDQGMLTTNPMPRRSLPRGASVRPDEQRYSFTTEDLQSIFNSPVFTQATQDTRGTHRKTPARFWIPLLALFHGCRLNELCQLYLQDIRMEADIPHIAMSRGQPEQRGKTVWFDRDIPIHSVILDLGFGDFVAQQRSCVGERLFPELTLCKRGYYSSSYQKWFTRLLVKASVKRPRISFHSFRHSFHDAARRAEVPTAAVCKLGGWKLPEVHERYGSFSLNILQREIEKIEYDLDVSQLTTWTS